MDEDQFAGPYVDVDEWRDEPVRHRYVHGGFAASETRFSFYLPETDRYEGRFFQHITPVPDSEHLAQSATGEEDRIGFAIASGGYFVETNGGGLSGAPGSSADPTIAAYRANAAAAQYSRRVAVEMYGDHRPFGYAFGGSGGSYRTIGGAENTSGVWDGFVPYVIGSPMSIPNVFTVRLHAQRILRDQFAQIIDALEPGGSGDPFAGLAVEEAEALAEVTRMGFPSRSWFGHATMGMHAFPVLYGGVKIVDPTYFDDFWTVPGYLGHAAPPSLVRDIVQLHCEIAATITDADADQLGLSVGRQPGQARGGVDTAWQGEDAPPTTTVAVRLTSAPSVDVMGAELIVHSGAAAGVTLLLDEVVGDIAIFGPGARDAAAQLSPGDAVEVDNRGFLAAQTYHRHQVPTEDFRVWDQFRDPDGTPTYPQRPMILGPIFAAAAAGTVQTGRFEGRMIVVETLLDRESFPWQADWYRSRARAHLGEHLDDHFRLWFVDNALHGDSELQEHPTRTISYLGVLHQALRDLSAWVERGIDPPVSTSYEVVDGQVTVLGNADTRGGLQPLATLTVDGGARADVRVGTEVTLRATVDVPNGTGRIVAVEFDLDGVGTFPVRPEVVPAQHVVVEQRHTFTMAGVHFPTVRVAAERNGDTTATFARVQNLARVRVVVAEVPT